MFHEYRHVISTIKNEDNHFHNLFDKHNSLDEKIQEDIKNNVDMFEIEQSKKEKLNLKDEIYNAIMAYKKKNNV